MKKILSILAICLFTITLTGCSSNDTISEIDYSKLESMIDNDESFIVEVIQTGCHFCEEFSPRFEAILKTNNIKAYSLNLSNLTEDEEEKFNDLTNITGTPAVLFFKDGKEKIANRIAGAVSNDNIKKHLEEAGYLND